MQSSNRYKNIVILTGSGISKESGIPTFRDFGGLWEGYDINQVASPEGFKKDPQLVYEFYNKRRKQLLSDEVAPDAAHKALAHLENWSKGDFKTDMDKLKKNVKSSTLVLGDIKKKF